MSRVLVADDHAIVRRGLRELLAEGGDVTVAEAASAAEALDLVRRERWDLVILDLQMPGRGGLDLLEDLHRERPLLPVLVLTMFAEDQYALRALRSGAAGYLTKESAPERLLEAVRKLLAGGRYVSPSLAETLASTVTQERQGPPHEQLSNREYQVFERLASGRTVGQVAEELSLSVKTISTYRARILEKLSLGTNADLTLYALRNGLVV